MQGEPYNLLQLSLREQFSDTLIIVATIANGWEPSYPPTAELYGKGIYQASIVVLEAGSLDRLTEELVKRIVGLG